jgi:hypothetical protein
MPHGYHQLIDGSAKDYARCQYTHGLHAAELTFYAADLQIAYTVLGRAKKGPQRIADAIRRAK